MRVQLLANAAILFLIELVSCQIVYRGKCKDPPIEDNFNLTRFAGSWHETSRSFTFFELLMRCVRTEYNISKEGKINIKIHGKDAIGATRSFEGKAEVKDPAKPARLRAKFRISTYKKSIATRMKLTIKTLLYDFTVPMSINYDILKTDYDNYAVLWSCNNMLGGRLGHTEQLWILSRHAILDDFMKSQLYDFLDRNNIRRRYLEGNSRQAKCFPSEEEDEAETAEVVPISSGNKTSQSLPESNVTRATANFNTTLDTDKAVLTKVV